jgi:diketogulonate reductase-like aldo/keto reductase
MRKLGIPDAAPASLERRRVLGGLAATGAGVLLGRLGATESGRGLLRRPIPGSGETIPAVGLGTYRVFDVGRSEAERAPLLDVLRALVEGGGSVVDSSPMYGRAEEVLGDLAARSGIRDALFLATKVWTTGREEGARQMERSLDRMQAGGRMDLMQVHNLVDWRSHLATLRQWKNDGRIRYLGVTHYTEGAYNALEKVIQTEILDFVQINYSLIEREAERRILPLAADRGVAVLVNRPYAQGGLFRRVRGRDLPPWVAELGIASWGQFFLKWILAHPAVTCAIPATSQVRHLVDNLDAGRGPLPDAAQRERMRRQGEA